jgi:ribosomal protein L40E
MLQFCSNCGEKVNYQMNFCSKCGNSLRLKAKESLKNTSNSESRIILDNHLKKKKEYKESHRDTRDFKSSLIIILGLIAFLVILGDIIGYYFFDKNISLIDSYREYFVNKNTVSLENYFLFISQVIFNTILPFIFILLLMNKMKESIIPSVFIIFIFIISCLINNNRAEINDYNINNGIINDTISTSQKDSLAY